MRYIKKPIRVEAVKWTGDNWDELEKFCPYGLYLMSKKRGLTIDTLEGKMSVSIGDFIVKGIRGEFYPVKPDIFKATYKKEMAKI